MTESEVKTIDDCINELRKHRNVYLKRSTPWRVVNRALHLIEQYRAIGTVEELKALKEKNEPKSPLRIPTDDTCLYYELRCPSCNAYMSGLIEMHHCTCGQRLSWE